MFDFITVPSDIDETSFDGVTLEQLSSQRSSEVAKFDFTLIFLYNPTLDDGRLSYRLICSRDLYDELTVKTIARRFEHFFFQFFSLNIQTPGIYHGLPSIDKPSLILPEEAKEMERVLFRRLSNILHEGMFFQCFI
jgi:hypothetical protein